MPQTSSMTGESSPHSQDRSPRLQTGEFQTCELQTGEIQSGGLGTTIDLIEVSRGLEVQGRHGRGAVIRRVHRRVQAAWIRLRDRVDPMEVVETVRGVVTTASPLDVLHSTSASDRAYQQVIATWPEGQPIWPQLRTLGAREELVRYLVRQDDTRSLDDRETGRAVQVYARFSARAALAPASRAHLAAGGIDATPAAAKLRVPAFVVIDRDHAFCAFLIDETAPDELESYRFFEPRTGGFITPRGSSWETHIERSGLVLLDVVGCDPQGRFDLEPMQGFFADGQRRMVKVRSAEVVHFLRDLSIAESGACDYDAQVGKAGGFIPFVRRQAHEIWRLDDAELIEAGRLAIGRSLRSHPARGFTVLTPDHYVGLIGRPDLRASLPGTPTPAALAKL